MPVLNNARWERFAAFVAQGSTLDEAYKQAGYKPHRGNPCTLANRPEVKERIEEITSNLTAAAAKAQQITVESSVGEFEQVRAAAMGQETRQFNAANAAIKGKAVLTGKLVERAEIGEPGEFDHMSDDELLASLRERFARLFGETQHLAIGDGSILLNDGTLKDRDRLNCEPPTTLSLCAIQAAARRFAQSAGIGFRRFFAAVALRMLRSAPDRFSDSVFSWGGRS